MPTAWRPTLREVVRAFALHDYALTTSVPSVAPLRAGLGEHIRNYVADYGETLAELPEQTWTTSFALWMGSFWEVTVDLWTVESGSSDMIMLCCVRESGDGFTIEISLVYVP